MEAQSLMFAVVDVRDADACQHIVDRVIARWGQLDTLVNNAGVYRARAFLDYTPKDFQDLLDVNFFGVLHLTQAVLAHMLERRNGRIVIIASRNPEPITPMDERSACCYDKNQLRDQSSNMVIIF